MVEQVGEDKSTRARTAHALHAGWSPHTPRFVLAAAVTLRLTQVPQGSKTTTMSTSLYANPAPFDAQAPCDAQLPTATLKSKHTVVQLVPLASWGCTNMITAGLGLHHLVHAVEALGSLHGGQHSTRGRGSGPLRCLGSTRQCARTHAPYT